MTPDTIAYLLRAGINGAHDWVEAQNLAEDDPVRLQVDKVHLALNRLHKLTHDGGVHTESGGIPKP